MKIKANIFYNLREETLFINKSENVERLYGQHIKRTLVVVKFNALPDDVFTGIFLLFKLEDVLHKELLKLLIGKVDAELFKATGITYKITIDHVVPNPVNFRRISLFPFPYDESEYKSGVLCYINIFYSLKLKFVDFTALKSIGWSSIASNVIDSYVSCDQLSLTFQTSCDTCNWVIFTMRSK